MVQKIRQGPAANTPEAEQENDFLWGIHAVHEALLADSLSEITIQRGKSGPRIQEIIDLARSKDIRLRFIDKMQMGLPRGCRHQGVVARRAQTVFLSLDRLLEAITGVYDNGKILVLDSIQDPRNLGSILRSALAAGFHYVILTRERSAPVSGTVARTSAGALAHLHLCQVVNLADTLKILQKKGFWIYGAVPAKEADSVYSTDFSGKIALVIGGESKGIRPLVKRSCDRLITVPMQTSFDSLNVSVAAAVIMFEIVRSRLA